MPAHRRYIRLCSQLPRTGLMALLIPGLMMLGLMTLRAAAAPETPPDTAAAQAYVAPAPWSVAGVLRLVLRADVTSLVITDPKPPGPDEIPALRAATAHRAWYGAIAWSPDEGLLAPPTTITTDFNTTDAAAAAALRQCAARRSTPTPCRVLALLRPEGWRPGTPELSRSATRALEASAGAPGIFAFSPTTRAFALAPADGAPGRSAARAAALDACRANVAPDDPAPQDTAAAHGGDTAANDHAGCILLSED